MNESMISLFMKELKCIEHFQALRRYYLMHAGDFIDNLSSILFERVLSIHTSVEFFLILILAKNWTNIARA